jgi:hypothetical protein
MTDPAIPDEILSELVALLRTHPEYGSVGIQIFYHQGHIDRITTAREVSRKAMKP